MTNKEKKDKSQTGPWIISITLIAALAVSYYQWNRHTAQTELYHTVMETYKAPNADKTLDSKNKSINEAIKEFNLKNYDSSLGLFKSIKPKTDSIYWYLGHIALINGKVYEARNYSKRIKDVVLQGEVLRYVDQIIVK